MPDEDQNIGTSAETAPSAAEPSSTQEAAPSTETSSSQQVTEGSDEQTPAAEVKLNTVGAALDAFKKASGDQSHQQQQPSFQRPNARDYSGLTAEEIPLFKKMGDVAFATLKPQYLEYKNLKVEHEKLKKQYEEGSKASFYDNEEAYQLTPEYKGLSANVNQLSAEIDHWQKQLASVRANEPWTPLVLDSKGNVVIGAPQEASPQAEATIVNQLMQGHSLKTSVADKLQQLQSNFSSQHKGFVSKISEVEAKIFEGADPKALEQAMQTKLPLFPPYLHNQPMVRTIAKLLAVNEGLIVMLNDAKAASNTNRLKANTVRAAGPNGGQVQVTGTKGNSVGSILDEFHKAKAMGVA